MDDYYWQRDHLDLPESQSVDVHVARGVNNADVPRNFINLIVSGKGSDQYGWIRLDDCGVDELAAIADLFLTAAQNLSHCSINRRK